MDLTDTLIIMIPLVLVASLLVYSAREAAEGRGFKAVRETVPAIIVLMVAMTVIILMGNASSFVWDEESGELTIQKNVAELDVQPWDSFASDVKSLIIEDGVAVATGAFDTMTNLEYVSIGDGSEIASGAFGVTMKDYLDRTMSDPEAGEYAGFGDGTLYYCDSSIFTYNATGDAVSGLTSEAASAVNIVLPNVHSSKTITGVANNAFVNKTTIELLTALPDSNIQRIGTSAFSGCTSLAAAGLPDELVTLGGNVFKNTGLASVELPSTVTTSAGSDFEGCTSLAAVELSPSLTAISNRMFLGCTSLASLEIPSSVTSIGIASFQNCAALASLEIPSSVTSIGGSAFSGCPSLTTFSFPSSLDSLGTWAFSGCTGATSVTFASGFAPTSYDATAFRSWTFYDSDGTTVIDKTVAANLAGKTFQGIASALVEVVPGQLSLTPQQLQQVQLHTQELQQQELDVQPLPFQPSLQTQEQEPVSA